VATVVEGPAVVFPFLTTQAGCPRPGSPQTGLRLWGGDASHFRHLGNLNCKRAKSPRRGESKVARGEAGTLSRSGATPGNGQNRSSASRRAAPKRLHPSNNPTQNPRRYPPKLEESGQAPAHPQNIKVLRGFGYGLDEKAVSSMVGSVFQPARKNGSPVPFDMQVEVSFDVR